LDEDSSVRARLNEQGVLNFGARYVINDKITATWTSQLNLKNDPEAESECADYSGRGTKPWKQVPLGLHFDINF